MVRSELRSAGGEGRRKCDEGWQRGVKEGRRYFKLRRCLQRCVKTRWRDAEGRRKGIHVRMVILKVEGEE